MAGLCEQICWLLFLQVRVGYHDIVTGVIETNASRAGETAQPKAETAREDTSNNEQGMNKERNTACQSMPVVVVCWSFPVQELKTRSSSPVYIKPLNQPPPKRAPAPLPPESTTNGKYDITRPSRESTPPPPPYPTKQRHTKKNLQTLNHPRESRKKREYTR